MKKVYLIIVVFISTLSSCTKILDEQIPKHSTIDANVIINQKSAQTALVGVYSYLADGQYWEWQYSRDFGHLAGTSGSNPSGAGIEVNQMFNTMEADQTEFLPRWQGAYKMILAANWVISLTEKLPDSEFELNKKNEILGEAHFLRFFAHFYLFRGFCYFWDTASPYGLIYRTEPANLSNHFQDRLNVKESYDKLLEDLDYCIENGPDVTDLYHSSKVSAKAFKVKLLAMRGNPEDQIQIIALANEVINSNKFNLEPTLLRVFEKRNSSKEIIFARYYDPNVPAGQLGVVRARAYNYYRATDYLLDIVQSSPQYLKAVRDTIQTSNTNTAFNVVGKICSNGLTEADLISNSYTSYLRLAEIQLLKAEAVARSSGSATDVCTILNVLLNRAEDTPLVASNYSSKEDLLEEVYNTMLKEVAMESGLDFEACFRFTDKFTGKRKILIQKPNLITEADLKKSIMPIPIEEMYINSKVKQNPGYLGGQ